MASLGQTLNPAEVPEDEKSFDPVPAGDYTVQAIEADVVDTKAGNGKRLTLTLEVMEGPHINRRIWEGINIENASVEAQRIGQRQLADLCLAVGLASISDSDELIGRPFRCRVGVQPAKGEFGPRNVVKRWHITPTKMQQAQAAAPAAQAAVSKPAAAANGYAAAKSGTRPWATR